MGDPRPPLVFSVERQRRKGRNVAKTAIMTLIDGVGPIFGSISEKE